MNNLNSTDDIVECPLCMEPLEVDDLNFYPCTCGYQICRFCWHRIRTDENQLCPACRKEYPENPADFKPLSQEEMVAFKFQKRQRDQKRKQEITENRKHLANVRVVQKNLVFVVGLPPRLADAEILKKHEYFGKYGKIHKVVINPSTTYAGVQGPSASAYVTYVHNPDALRAIQSVNNIMIDGRLIKTSLGTTKYCSHFMKNQQCPKSDCMYLHELGDPEASFTKEEMHQGKHQDYEKRLHDVLIATAGTSTAGGLVTTSSATALLSNNSSSSVKIAENSKGSVGLVASNSSKALANVQEVVVGSHHHTSSAAVAVASASVNGQQTEAWPSLSVSPVSKKDTLTQANGPKSKKERQKQEKAKAEKNGKTKNKNSNSNQNNQSNSNLHNMAKEAIESSKASSDSSSLHSIPSSNSSSSSDKPHRNPEGKERNTKPQSISQTAGSSSNCQSQQRKEEPSTSVVIPPANTANGTGKMPENEGIKSAGTGKTKSQTEVLSKSQETSESRQTKAKDTHLHNTKSEDTQQQQGNPLYVSNSNISNSSISSSSSSSSSTSSSTSTGSNNHHHNILNNDAMTLLRKSPLQQDLHKSSSLEESHLNTPAPISAEKSSDSCPFTESIERTANLSENFAVFNQQHKQKAPSSVRELLQQNHGYNGPMPPLQLDDNLEKLGVNKIAADHLLTPTSTTDLNSLKLFEDNSFFSLGGANHKLGGVPPQHQPLAHPGVSQLINTPNKLLEDPLLGGRSLANLPDLINGIDGYQTNLNNCTNDWEDAFKSVILKTNKQMEEKLQQQQQLQQHIHNHHQMKQQEDLRKLQELQKRNILLNSIRAQQMNSGGGGGGVGLGADRQSHFMPLQNNPLLQAHQLAAAAAAADNPLQNPLPPNLAFDTNNMSKFFDFHKHQQQQQQKHYGGPPGGAGLGAGGLNDNFHMMSLLENKPLNSQLLDHNSLMNSHLQQQQQQHQKQKLYQKMEPLMHHPQLQQQPPPKHNLHTPQNHMKNQYLQNSNADDDLGFDPFIETQKALAELIENEEEQQQQQLHHQQQANPIAPPKQQLNQPPPPPPHQDPMLEYMQRLRMPPPGFSHLNSNLGGYGGAMDPRLHTNQNSKILPFMNLPGHNNGQHMPPQQQQPPPPQHPLQMPNPNVWGTHLGNMQQQQQQQQQQTMGGLRHENCNPTPTMGNPSKSNYSGSDWTAMDPAILSFRQFSFPQQQQQQQQMGGPQQMPPLPPPQQQQQQQPQPPQQDLFLQHLSQQSGFGLGGGVGSGQHNNGVNNPMAAAAAAANAGLLQSQSQLHSSQAQGGHVNVDANVQGMLEFLKTHQFV